MIRHLISMVALLALVASARATDQVVTDSGDNGGPNQLRAKLTAAQSTGGGTITFNVGTATIVLTSGILPTITSKITIDGANVVTLSGNNATPAFQMGSGATLTLNNLTITKCLDSNNDGGAIRNGTTGGTLNITNCKFLQNIAGTAFSGGAIVSYGPLNITNSEFGNNMAGNGGAVYPRFAPAVTTITGCNFHDNSTLNTTNGWGGAMLLWDGAPVTITNSTLNTNTAQQGGAIYVLANASLNISNSQVNSNVATNGNGLVSSGGGIYSAGTSTITQSTLSNNSANYQAGGIYNAGNVNLTNVTLSGNSTIGGNGGGIFNQATATLTNVTLSGNSASFGGGVFNSGGTATLTNVTLSGNSGTNTKGGGAIYHYGIAAGKTITLKNTIVANSPSGGDCQNDPGSATNITSNGFNLADDTSCGLTNTGDHQGAAFNPRLGPLQIYGGPTATLLPGPGSPAIDAGTGMNAPTTDQRGVMRPQFAAVDIGAVEVTRSDLPILANISTRIAVQTGDNVLIGGFIITGTQPKKVIIRAIGPSLPFAGVLADPTLELYQGNTLLESNDNWMDSPNKQAIVDSTIPPSNNLESAIVQTLPANSTGYTAIVRGANNGTGIGVVEAYDLDRTVDSKLANISTRGFVQTSDNVLIAGTIVLGQAPQKVIIRAIGPSLPVAGALADPTLQLIDGNGTLLEENDNWVDSPNKQAIIDSTIPPSNDRESAIVRTLLGNGAQYTAIVRGVNNTTGIAVVEIYALQ